MAKLLILKNGPSENAQIAGRFALNPPELGIAEQEIKQVKRGRFVLLPITDQTRSHGTHTLPAVWHQYLEELLNESK